MLKIAKANSGPQKAPLAIYTPHLKTGGNKIFFISLGCPRNLVDSEVMLGILLRAGYEVAEALEEADYLIINTCGFLEASRTESRETVEMALKDKKEGAKVIVAGCMVQTHSQELKQAYPEISYLLGSGDVEGILRAVQAETPGESVSDARSYLEAGEVPRTLSTPKHYAYLKIAEGCKKRCAYCVIPTIKGPLKSKPKEKVLKEFNTLLKQGVKEIILIAQDLGDYGKDFGGKKSELLIDLIRSMLELKEDFWLRLLYLYPDEITDELIELMKSDERICPYLDMPIQHINNRVLKSMHRATSKEQVVDTITKLRKAIPHISIRTSLIVGYPGETEEEFEELCDFVRAYPLENVGIFSFSREPGSYAYDLEGQIEPEVKEKRREKLVAIQQEVLRKENQRFVGKTLPVIVEGYHPESNLLMVGRHPGQCPEIDGLVIINDTSKVKAFGKIYRAKVTDAFEYDLVARIL